MYQFKSVLHPVISLFLLFIMLVFTHAGNSHAHEIRPSVIDIGLAKDSPEYLEIRLALTAETYLSGMDVSDLTDTDNSPVAMEYDRLRALPPEQLVKLVEQAFPSLGKNIGITLDQRPLHLQTWILKDIIIEDVTNPDLIRETALIFLVPVSAASLPEQAMIHIEWPAAMGGLLIRQHGDASNANYVEFLQTGGQSKGFALGEIYQPSFLDIIKRYIHSGIIHIVPYGLDHILFVIGLLAFSRSAHHLLLQISLFTVAHTLTLAAASLGWIRLSPGMVEPLIALSIAYIGIENLLKSSPHLTLARNSVVFAFGLLHGLGFASVLADFGLPDTAFITSLISFNIGVELGQLMIVIPLFILFRFILVQPHQYRYGFQAPVSLAISFVGIYWFFERVGMIGGS